MISFPFYLQRNYTFAAHKHSTCPTNWANGNSYISNGLFLFIPYLNMSRTSIRYTQNKCKTSRLINHEIK